MHWKWFGNHFKQYVSVFWHFGPPCSERCYLESIKVYPSIAPVDRPNFATMVQDQVARRNIRVGENELVKLKQGGVLRCPVELLRHMKSAVELGL